MKLFAFLSIATVAVAFSPSKMATRTKTELGVSRRDAIAALTGAATTLVAAESAFAANKAYQGVGSDRGFANDLEVVAAQQPTGDKIDLNAAFVSDYKQFPGLYPSVAGKIASNGPYTKVNDVYSMAKLDKRESQAFKKYEKEFTVLPPQYRTFNERINERVST